MFLGRNIFRATILLIFAAAVLLLLTGCGPGQPFEIEELLTP